MFEQTRKLAEQENPVAQRILGLMYLNGTGIPRDYAAAETWLRKAADQHDILAQSRLGLMYLKGEAVTRDPVEAAVWLSRAAERGNDDAQFFLGVMYYKGDGVTQNYAEAKKLLRMAAMRDNSDAQFLLGMIYIGRGTESDDTVEAYRWLSLFIDRMKDKPNPSVQKAKDVRDSLAGKMMPQQMEDAQKPVEELKSAQSSSSKPISGNVLKSKLIKRVDPVYPVEAKRMRLSGMVILVVTVDEEGNVEDVRVTRGYPELADAAVDAVRQWKYSPTLSEGKPIRVTATVTVNFMLGR
jgi:TonB family protein